MYHVIVNIHDQNVSYCHKSSYQFLELEIQIGSLKSISVTMEQGRSGFSTGHSGFDLWLADAHISPILLAESEMELVSIWNLF